MTTSTYGQQVRDVFAERLKPHLGPHAARAHAQYQLDLDRIRDHVDDAFGQVEGLPRRVAILSDGLVASFGALARTWCIHGTMATGYQNAHFFATTVRTLLATLQQQRMAGTDTT